MGAERASFSWKNFINSIKLRLKKLLYRFFCIFPLKKVVFGSSFFGKQYENNTRYIVEAIHEENPKLKIVVYRKGGYVLKTPNYIKTVSSEIKRAWYYATSRVWIDTHNIPLYVKRRKKQLTIFAFHAGLLQKKTAADVKPNDIYVKHTADNTVISISNSVFMDNVIRSALLFKGKIWRTGLPKNDIFNRSGNLELAKTNVLSFYNLKPKSKICLFAPTHSPDVIKTAFNLNFERIKKLLSAKYGGNWVVLLRQHPANIKPDSNLNSSLGYDVVDANYYPDMQEMILAADIFVTDYSSTIFDVAERGIPCFMYASNIDSFVSNVRSLYFRLEELPFPLAKSPTQFEAIVNSYSGDIWQQKWLSFSKKVGLVDNGESSKTIAKLVCDYYKKGEGAFDGISFT